MAGAVVVLVILGEFGAAIPGSGRITWLLMLGVLLLYEPVFVWRRGATIGHAMNDLQVVRTSDDRTPGLGQAFVRYVVKTILGAPSFVTMAVSRRHQAVHDMLTRTTVQLATTADADEHDFHLERVDDPDVVMPSGPRRAVVVGVYLVALFVGFSVVVAILDPSGCTRDQSCQGAQRVVIDAATLTWIGLSLFLIVAGWKGLLFGARRDRQEII